MGVMGIDLGTTTISIVMMDADSGAILGSRTVAHHGFLEDRRGLREKAGPARDLYHGGCGPLLFGRGKRFPQ